jgi:hypothetical protein
MLTVTHDQTSRRAPLNAPRCQPYGFSNCCTRLGMSMLSVSSNVFIDALSSLGNELMSNADRISRYRSTSGKSPVHRGAVRLKATPIPTKEMQSASPCMCDAAPMFHRGVQYRCAPPEDCQHPIHRCTRSKPQFQSHSRRKPCHSYDKIPCRFPQDTKEPRVPKRLRSAAPYLGLGLDRPSKGASICAPLASQIPGHCAINPHANCPQQLTAY